jgi:hypothetical protein
MNAETVPSPEDVPEENDDREDVEPNEEPDDVDDDTPGHPDTTPDDDAAAESKGYGIRGVEAWR